MRQSFGVSHTKFVLFLADEFRRKRDQMAWVLVMQANLRMATATQFAKLFGYFSMP